MLGFVSFHEIRSRGPMIEAPPFLVSPKTIEEEEETENGKGNEGRALLHEHKA